MIHVLEIIALIEACVIALEAVVILPIIAYQTLKDIKKHKQRR